MKIVTLSYYDKAILNPQSELIANQREIAKAVDTLCTIMFTTNKLGLVAHDLSQNAHILPTNAPHKLLIPFYALFLGIRQKADIVIAQDPFVAGLIAYGVAQLTGAKLQLQEHGDFFSTPYWRSEKPSHRLWYELGLWLLRRADCVRVVSKRIQRTLIAHGVEEKRIVVFPVPSDTQKTVIQEEIALVRKNIPEYALVVLSMARFVKQKNLPLLIRAFAHAAKTVPNAYLLLVGSGPEKARMQQEIQQSGAQERIVLQDWTDNPTAYIAASDIYALSSQYEGWARVLIEVMAQGVPIISTDVGCVGEVVRHEKEALVVPVNNETSFADALVRLLRDAPLRARLGEQGITAVEALAKESYTKEYERLLGVCFH